MRIVLLSICLLCGLTATAQTTPASKTAEPPVQREAPAENAPGEGAPVLGKPKEEEPLFEGIPDVMPSFQGDDLNSFHRLLMQDLRYPLDAMAEGIQGQVLVEFTIEKDGMLRNVKIVDSPDPRLSAEVMRLFWDYTAAEPTEPAPTDEQIRFVGKHIPMWTPAMDKGVPVRMRLSLPIDFKYEVSVIEVEDDSEGSEDDVYVMAEQMPEFENGSWEKFCDWVMRKVKYPASCRKEGIEGRVLVSVIIERNGDLTYDKILRSPHEDFSEEVRRVIALSPKWKPGLQKGLPVRVSCIIPVSFRL